MLLVQCWTLLSSLVHPSLLWSALPGLRKEGIFRPFQTSPLRRTHLEWVSNKGKHLHTTSAQRALVSPLDHLPYVWQRPRWEKGKGGFPVQNHNVACLHELCGFCLAWRKLAKACFLQFQALLSNLFPQANFVLLCPACEKKDFSDQIKLLLQGEHVWMGFQDRETGTPNQCPESIGQHLGSLALGPVEP